MIKLDIQRFSDGKVVIDTQLNTKDFDNGLDRMQNATKKSGATIKNIVAGLGITKLISKGMQLISSSVDDAVKRTDTLNNFSKVMSNLGISSKEADKSIKKMSDKLTGLPTTLDQGARAVQRFTSANGNVKKSTDIFLSLNNAIIAGGTSAEIQATALEQLTQAYARGKPDMMEWRTAMTAMPAQLKQVAEAMGFVNADELGKALREGTVSMDDFMDTVTKLNKEGIKGFSNFEKQARNSTQGIGNAIVVAKTQITKGVADIITGLNKGLKSSGFGGISTIIANFGKKAKEVLDGVARALSKIDFKSIVNVMKKLVPVLSTVVSGFIAYKVALTAIKAINIASMIAKTVISFVQLIPAITSAKDAMLLLNMTFNANPVGLLVAGITAVTAAFVIFSNKQNEVNKTVEKSKATLKDYNETMKDVRKQKDESLSQSMNEISYYKSLSDELKSITDENGRVKDGYEERAKFITQELSKALGMEITMTDGVINQYQNIQNEIDKTLDKKKAEAYFEAHREEYNESLKKETDINKRITELTNERNSALETINNTLNEEAKASATVRAGREELLKLAKGEIKGNELSVKGRRAFLQLSQQSIDTLKKEKNSYLEVTGELKKANKSYAEIQTTVDKWRMAEEALANENYNAVAKIFNDTVSFNGKTAEANNTAFENAKASRMQYLDFLRQHQDKYGQDFINKEQERINKELEQLENEKNEANKKVQEKNNQILASTTKGLNDQLLAIGSKGVEFQKTADGNMQLYINGIASSMPVSTKTANDVTTNVLNELKKGNISVGDVGKELQIRLSGGIDANMQKSINASSRTAKGVTKELETAETGARTIGGNISSGLGNGILGSLGKAVSAAASLASQVISTVAKKAETHSPSKATFRIGKYIDDGLIQGIEKGEKETLKTTSNYVSNVMNEFDKINIDNKINDMYKSMRKTIDIENAKVQSSVEGGGIFNTIANTTPVQIDIKGDIEMDNQKVGRIVAPAVSKTIKSGGGY